MIRGPIAEISLSAIAHNLQSVKKIVKNRSVIAVVKADAYGHGAVEVSKRLLKEGVSHLAVAYTGEAKELRDAAIKVPIIVLFDKGEIGEFFDYNLIPVIFNLNSASSLSAEARKRGMVIKVHVKVDTGMGRLGLTGNHVLEDLLKIAGMPGIAVTGLLSHFSEADLSDRSFAMQQLENFHALRESLSRKVRRKILSHMANSAAVLSFKESHLDAVRPGIMLYGYSPLNTSKEQRVKSKEYGMTTHESKNLIPAMTVKTRILCIRDVPSGTPISYGRTFITKRPSKIGVIPLGYADGYSRLLSNKAEVLVKGKRVPVIGRVCMDLTMIDLTDVKIASENDEVVILGKQGTELITADEIAFKANTISYEILTSLGSRSQRVYV